MRNWILPEHIEDILPADAARVELLRARLLELFRVHGYQLVYPPMLEYLESLLTGTGHDLDLRTFKLVDQLSGRMMGLRADITPQVARIDAHLLNKPGATRLCYCGTVLHTRPRGLYATREPLQIGAELYGHAGPESDVEIHRLLVAALAACGIGGARIDVGHVGVFGAICRNGGVTAEREAEIQAALEGKDVPGLAALCDGLPVQTSRALMALPGLYGDAGTLSRARAMLPPLPEIARALDDLTRFVEAGSLPVSVDLADLRGYHYHTGVVFAAYAAGHPNAIALGGRYDKVGAAFGRARAATGFSMDLRDVVRLSPASPEPGATRAPWSDDPALASEIARLRAGGEVVVQDLPGAPAATEDRGRELVLSAGRWQVKKRD